MQINVSIRKNVLSLLDCVSSPLVYLTIGVLPATAQHDLEILGQLAMCDGDIQNVRNVIIHNLSFFDEKFVGQDKLGKRPGSMDYQIHISILNIPGDQTGGGPIVGQ